MTLFVEQDIDDITRFEAGAPLSEQVNSRSCTLAVPAENHLSALVGEAMILDLSGSRETEITAADLQLAFENGKKNSRSPLFGNGKDNSPTRLLLKTCDDGSFPSERILKKESMEWLLGKKLELLGVDGKSVCLPEAEEELFDRCRRANLTLLLNLDLRGIVCGALYRMSGSALKCPTAPIVPARAVLMF